MSKPLKVKFLNRLQVLRTLRSNWMAWYALWFLIGYMMIMVLSICFFDLNPYDQQTMDFFRPPHFSFSFSQGFSKFILGTDDLGRDVYARLIYGAKNTFLYAFIAAVISSYLGSLIGFISALYPSKLMYVVRILISSLRSYTPVIIAFAIITILGPSLKNATVAITVSLIPRFASICYDITNDELKKEYIKAVQLDGASTLRMFQLSLYPNIRDVLIIQFTKHFSMAILDLAALGFLGLCASNAEPELGTMIAENMDMLYSGNYWIIIFPGMAIVTFVIAINVLSDGIRNVLHKENL